MADNRIRVRHERTGHEALIHPRVLPGYQSRGWDVKPDNTAKRSTKKSSKSETDGEKENNE